MPTAVLSEPQAFSPHTREDDTIFGWKGLSYGLLNAKTDNIEHWLTGLPLATPCEFPQGLPRPVFFFPRNSSPHALSNYTNISSTKVLECYGGGALRDTGIPPIISLFPHVQISYNKLLTN